MTQITAATVPSRGVCNLKVDITSVEANPTVDISPKEAVMYQVDDTPANDILLTELVLNLGAKKKDPVTQELIGERMWLTGGAVVTNSNGDEVVRYTATFRGLSDVFATVPTAADELSRNFVAHDEGEVCTIAADWLFRQQANTFNAATSTIDRTYGETIAANKPWMFGANPNEAKIFEYDGTNPAQGLTIVAGILDDVKTVATFGYKQVDFPGSWSPGVLYVDTDGTFNQAPTVTSLPFGQILNDDAGNSDELLITGFAPSDLQKASQLEAEAGTNDSKYMTPLKTKQSILAEGVGSIGDIKMVETTGTGVLGVAGNQAAGWAVCDNTTPASQGVTSPIRTEATPDMVSNFVRGNATASGATGGAATGAVPDHNHQSFANSGAATGPYFTMDAGTGAVATNRLFDAVGAQVAMTLNGTRLSGNYYTANKTGLNVPTIPPYYEVVYMIKVR